MAGIPESLQVKIEDYVRSLAKQITVGKTIIFGSHAKGSAHAHSDIDIAVFSDSFKGMSRAEGIRILLLTAMEHGCDLDIEPQAFTMDDYRQPIGIIEEIIRTGIEIPVS